MADALPPEKTQEELEERHERVAEQKFLVLRLSPFGSLAVFHAQISMSKGLISFNIWTWAMFIDVRYAKTTGAKLSVPLSSGEWRGWKPGGSSCGSNHAINHRGIVINNL